MVVDPYQGGLSEAAFSISAQPSDWRESSNAAF
jgi:hypothetical protein